MCPSSFGEFYSGLGAWYSCTYLCTPGFFLLLSFVSASSFCVFGSFPSRSRLTATREVVQLPQELFSVNALGRHFKVPLCHCWRAFRALWYGSSEGIFKDIWLASRKLFSPSRVPASLSCDPRWKVAPCSRVVCLTGLFVVGDQYRYGFQCRLSAFPSLWSFVRRSSHSLWLRMMRYVSVFAPS